MKQRHSGPSGLRFKCCQTDFFSTVLTVINLPVFNFWVVQNVLISSTSKGLSSTQTCSPPVLSFPPLLAVLIVFVWAAHWLLPCLCMRWCVVFTWLLWISSHVAPVTALIWRLFKQQIGPRRFPNRPTIPAYNYILRRYLSVSPL